MPLDPEKVTGIVEKNWPSFASTREPARGLWINKGYPFRSYVTKDGVVVLEFDILHRRMNIADEYLEAYFGEWKKNFNSENGFSDDIKKYIESVLQQSGVDFSRVEVKRNMESERDFGPRALRVTVYPPVASAAAKK